MTPRHDSSSPTPPESPRAGDPIDRRVFVRTTGLIVTAGIGTACGHSTIGQVVVPPPPELDPAHCTLSVSPGSILVAATSTITLQARDTTGAVFTSGGATVVFHATPGTGTATGHISTTTDHSDGTYTATYTADTAGTAETISAKVNNVDVVTTLPAIAVTAPGSAPTVSSISPDLGDQAGGLSVAIAGTHFTGATGVTIGGVACTNVSVVSDVSITATTGASGNTGAKDVVVTNGTGPGTLAGAYTYLNSPDLLANASFEDSDGNGTDTPAGVWNGFASSFGGSGKPTNGVSIVTIARATDQHYSGSTSVKAVWQETGGGVNDADNFWYKAGSSVDRFWLRLYFRIALGWVLHSSSFKFVRFRDQSGGNIGGVYLNSANGLGFLFDWEGNASPATILATASIPVDSWHCLEIDYWRNGDTSQGGDYPSAATYVDGVQQTHPDGTDNGWLSGNMVWMGNRLYGRTSHNGPIGRGRATTFKLGGFNAFATLDNDGSAGAAPSSAWMDRIALSSLGRIGP